MHSNSTDKRKMACNDVFLIKLMPIYICNPILKIDNYFQEATKLALKAKLNSPAIPKCDYSMHSSNFVLII